MKTINENKKRQPINNLTNRSRLNAYIDRLEILEEDKKAVMEDMKEVFAELKGDGFEPKTIRKIIAMRKKDADERAEEEAILNTYMAELGMM